MSDYLGRGVHTPSCHYNGPVRPLNLQSTATATRRPLLESVSGPRTTGVYTLWDVHACFSIKFNWSVSTTWSWPVTSRVGRDGSVMFDTVHERLIHTELFGWVHQFRGTDTSLNLFFLTTSIISVVPPDPARPIMNDPDDRCVDEEPWL